MNRILIELKQAMLDSVKQHLPEVHLSDLEGNGAVFYMNGKNGTEFDWYVNEKISDFMMFYNDKDNMGAVKALLCCDGTLLLYVYGERGKTLVQEIQTNMDVSENEIISLAVLLRNEADDKKRWDADIAGMNTDVELNDDQLDEFLANEHDYDAMREQKAMLGQMAYVSRKILDEGWKVGYMCRDEAVTENDSGWSFMAGDEDDAYNSDYKNIALMSVYEVVQLDETVWKYIHFPVGTRMIRISSEEFEEDHNDKAIYMERNS